HWRQKPGSFYLLWWTVGVFLYGVGTLTESLTTLLGWNEWVFRAWYISGALLGGAPLAQGTVYLLFSDKTAHRMTTVLVSLVGIAAAFVLISPIQLQLVENFRLSGRVLTWQWVRAFSPFINTYAFIFLVGGAFWSAWKYWQQDKRSQNRFWGNLFIAVGALLPGIGGASARAGYVEVLYITELIGICLIWLGYRVIVADTGKSVHVKQRSAVFSQST
ncbi:MAG: hypothetical protein ACE5HS_16695, partial [bacterium]